jgi:hypothetical protein
MQVPMDEDATVATQVNALLQEYGLTNALNPTGIAFAVLQLWYYHYPIEEVRSPSP